MNFNGYRIRPVRHRPQYISNSSPIHLSFQCFHPNAVPPRSLPIVPEHCELVGPLGLEPRTKGFTSAPPFPAGVDYLFTPVGCGTLLPVIKRDLRAQVVSAPSGGVPPAWLRIASSFKLLRFP